MTHAGSDAFDEPCPSAPNDLRQTNSLVEHLRVCHGLVTRPDLDASLLAWLFVYLRLLGGREVRQGMRGLYQTKDLSHIQDIFSLGLSRAYVESGTRGSSARPLERALIRNMVAFVPRGGGNGDELRLFILDVMRRHGIREGHRPGIEDPFLEQWHQKLHSCSTAEDITICEAYIAFQESNSHDRYFRTLWERGGITAEYLRNMPRPLTDLPRYMPQLVPDLRHLLWILKQIHAGSSSLHYLIEVSKWQLEASTVSLLESIRDNFGAWWIPGRVVQARQQLEPYLRGGTPRDPLMLDVALDGVFKSAIERLDLRALNRDDLMELVSLTLANLTLSYGHEQVVLCRDLWERIWRSSPRERWSRSWSLRAFAALSTLQLLVQDCSETFHHVLQPRARALAASMNVARAYVTNFAEEVIRGQPVFALSKLLDALTPLVRQAGGVGPWRIVSCGTMAARGTVSVCGALSATNGVARSKPHVLVVEKVDGTEDLPAWVSAVLTSAEVDLLSHLAIRARAGRVLLATCYAKDELAAIGRHEGTLLTLQVKDEGLAYESGGDETLEVSAVQQSAVQQTAAPHGGNGASPERSLPPSKSGNLATLAAKLPDHIRLPLGVALAPELFERALASASDFCAAIQRLEAELEARAQDYPSLLAELRDTVMRLPLAPEIIEEIHSRLTESGVITHWSPVMSDAIGQAVKRVWASLWNERAHLSRRARGIPRESVHMGVLLQQAIPSEHAFVVHTRHPVSDDPREMLAEIVVGLGETLAGNAAGAPLRVVLRRDTREHRVEAYPSKPIARFASSVEGSLIVRSDCNDEDQQSFSGAGLYDSCFLAPPARGLVAYAGERLFWDEAFQRQLSRSILEAAEVVESIMGSPQDIEGAVRDEHLYVVQTRDQQGRPAKA